MSERGTYGQAPQAPSGSLVIVGGDPGKGFGAIVGSKWFHGIHDRQLALDQIAADFTALSNDLTVWHQANADAPTASASAQWLAADVTPTITQWQTWKAKQSASWWTMAATSWDSYEAWRDRLVRLRELARAHGVTLQSSEPAALPKTVWQKSDEGSGSEAGAWLGVLKIAVIAGIGITGFVAFYAALRDITKRR